MYNYQVVSVTPIANPKFQLAMALAILVAAYYRIPMVFLLLLICWCYLAWSYFWTLTSCRSSQGMVTTGQDKIFVHESFTQEFRLINKSIFPLVRCGISFTLPAQFRCESDAAFTVSEITTSPSLADEIIQTWKNNKLSYAWFPDQKEVSFKITITPTLRGVYLIPPAISYVGDPSGLFQGTRQLGKEQYLYVLPHPKNTHDFLRSFALEDNDREDNFGLDDRYQVQGIRDYQINDPQRSINWYATARTSSLKTNMYERKDSELCLVVLDLSCPGYTDNPGTTRIEDPLLEDAISLAAGIALYHIEQGARTAFYTNAPRLAWETRVESFATKKTIPCLLRKKGITTLDFEEGVVQAQNILKICASIDETSRGTDNQQKELWSKIQEVPANTLVYIIGYYNPPKHADLSGYKINYHNQGSTRRFYTEQMGKLAGSKIRFFDLSQRSDSYH
ncbi:MAG: DUF58 domain-containing protein [Syntrophomonadaceae bacterium]|jgi:hypothetical protein